MTQTQILKVTKPMWQCPYCKPTLWFGSLEQLKEHIAKEHEEARK